MKNWFNAFPRMTRRSFLRLAGATALTQIPLVRAEEGRTAGAAEIWTSAFAGTKVWGYVNKHSVMPGEPFDLMLSTAPSGEATEGRIEFFRIGHHPPECQKLIWTSQQFAVTHQPVLLTPTSLWVACLPSLGERLTSSFP